MNLKYLIQVGCEFEDKIFEGLRKATTEIKAQNTVVLSGLNLKDLNSKTTGEIDFLIISLPLMSIIQIEAKNGNNQKNRDHANKQLSRGQEFFWNNCPFQESENWNYTKMMCFGESVEKDICGQCKPFILSANFVESNKTQPVAEKIAEQFKTFWTSEKIRKGKNTIKNTSFSFFTKTKIGKLFILIFSGLDFQHYSFYIRNKIKIASICNSNSSISEQHEAFSSYIKKIQFLLMYMFQREQVFSKTDVANYATHASDKMFALENQTFFWTKHQQTLIDINPKRVIFTSEFGTGKTTLLKAKAKQLGRERYFQDLKNKSKKIETSSGKIFFILFTDRDSLLTQSLKWELKDLKEHLEVHTLTSDFIFNFI